MTGEILKPGSEDEIQALIETALANGEALEIMGAGSKRALGRPVCAERRLSLAGLSGIGLYEPAELVLSARAGTPMAAIERTLAGECQCLAFEPPDWSHLLGATAGGGTLGGGTLGSGTLGGAIGCNLAGPRRVKMGAARDHILGFRAVNGRAEIIKSGGRVMKNVTGFDLSKLMAGSYGTLAVVTEITVKLLPAPEHVRTLLIAGLDDPAAVAVMNEAAGSAQEVSGLAHYPANVTAACGIAAITAAGLPVTAMRLEGIAPSVASRFEALAARFAGRGEIAELEDRASSEFWRHVRDVRAFAADTGPWRTWEVWRLSLPPTSGAAVMGNIAGELDGAWFYDWAGGLAWVAVAPGQADDAAILRRAAGAVGGEAGLVRAPARRRAEVPAFAPLAPALRRLTGRLKDAFDPRRILNPGRMQAGL